MTMTNEELAAAIREAVELRRIAQGASVLGRLFTHLESLLEEQSRRASQPVITLSGASRVTSEALLRDNAILDDPAFRELGGTESED